ncbi:hypothetical protein [Halosegnis longus]|uniref:DUF7993 domain-containing protein n=1 Tax=Halosegnis longus TaxID=2216012 RepID=A0AAJ4R7A8_9EURY|nr:hypothetical protein Nmn1133_03615 [Salella cibi]
MVEDRTTDGTRIAELLSSEIHGRESGALGSLTVTDADREVEPREDGAYAFTVSRDDAPVATIHIHPDRIHLEIATTPDRVTELAGDLGLRVRPKAVEPPQTLVFIEDGAEVKRATDLLVALA